MLNLGAFFGIYAFTYVTHYTGRRPAFAVAYLAALFSTAMVFQSLDEFHEIFWMIPLMGFCQLALFGGYAIYFRSCSPHTFAARAPRSATTWADSWRPQDHSHSDTSPRPCTPRPPSRCVPPE